jgi:hypothetical protein
MTTNNSTAAGFEVTSTTDRFPVRPYTGDETAPDGYSLVVLSWKQTAEMKKAGTAARSAVVTIVPKIYATSVEPAGWTTILHDRIAELQSLMVRELVEADEKATDILRSEVDESAVMAYARKQSAGKRLTGASIGEWVDASLAEPLMAALAEKVAGITPDQLAGAVQGYRKVLCGLAAAVPQLTAQDLEQADKALTLAPESPMRAILAEKVTTLRTKSAPKQLVTVNL